MGNTTGTTGGRPRSASGRSEFFSGSPRSIDEHFEIPKKRIFAQQSSEYGGDGDEDYRVGRVRTTTIVNSNLGENALPTVFKWEGGGKEVYLTGTFTDWKPIKMCPSHGDFVAIVDVPEGVHEFKYIVDGTETINTDSQKDDSATNNIIHVKKSDFEVFEALAMDLASNTSSGHNNTSSNQSSFNSGSPPGDYGQQIPNHLRSRSVESSSSSATPTQQSQQQQQQRGSHHQSGAGPPILPPHLLQVILNNPNVNAGDSTLLPQPNHVMLNHLYALSIKDGVMVLSCTYRFRKKYVTTLLYKPI